MKMEYYKIEKHMYYLQSKFSKYDNFKTKI